MKFEIGTVDDKNVLKLGKKDINIIKIKIGDSSFLIDSEVLGNLIWGELIRATKIS